MEVVKKTNEELLAPFKDIHLWNFIAKLHNNENFTIIKYGDFLEMMYIDDENRGNCDGSHYDKILKSKLMDAYTYFLLKKDAYICKWDTELYVDLTYDIQFAKYYNFLDKFLYFNIIIHKLDDKNNFDEKMISFYKTIINSKRDKIYICNEGLAPYVQQIFDCRIIVVPAKDAHNHHLRVLTEILNIITPNTIVMTSCGFYAPYLVKELTSIKNDITCIDIGSSFDGLYRPSRNFNWMPEYKQRMSMVYLDNY